MIPVCQCGFELSDHILSHMHEPQVKDVAEAAKIAMLTYQVYGGVQTGRFSGKAHACFRYKQDNLRTLELEQKKRGANNG